MPSITTNLPWGIGKAANFLGADFWTSARRRLADGTLGRVILALFVVLLVLFVVFPLIGMALWALFTTIVVGLILGALGRLVVPGRQRISLLATALAGIVGAIVGGFLGDQVLGVGWFPTLLLEIGVSALLVIAMSAPRGTNRVSRLR